MTNTDVEMFRPCAFCREPASICHTFKQDIEREVGNATVIVSLDNDDDVFVCGDCDKKHNPKFPSIHASMRGMVHHKTFYNNGNNNSMFRRLMTDIIRDALQGWEEDESGYE